MLLPQIQFIAEKATDRDQQRAQGLETKSGRNEAQASRCPSQWRCTGHPVLPETMCDDAREAWQPGKHP